MTKIRLNLLCIAVVAALVGLPDRTYADFVNRLLPGHPQAITGFTGTGEFDVTTNSGAKLEAEVDYAVFAPGAFPGVFTPYSGFSPSSSSDYIYAYQIYNVGPLHGGESELPLSFLSVGLVSGSLVSSLGRDAGFDPSLLDLDAAKATVGSHGAGYRFKNDVYGHRELLPDEFSMVLLLSSARPPMLLSSFIVDGGGQAMDALPSPLQVPTPAAGLAVLVGLLGLGGAKRVRRALARD